MGTTGGTAVTILIELSDGGWVARLQEVVDEDSVRGSSLSEVRRRLHRVIRRRFGEDVAIREQIRIDTEIGDRVSAVREARDELEQAREDLRNRMVKTAGMLRERGLSSRDVGALLGVSQQRVSQLWQQGSGGHSSDFE